MRPTIYEVELISGKVITNLTYDQAMKYFFSHAGSVVRPCTKH